MLREESLEEITDGKRYGVNDMVRADAAGCKGCSKCCETMTDTIILNPQDLMRISLATGKNLGELISAGVVEVNMVDGVILPNIGSNGGRGCSFLQEGRCGIYETRPDICRLFPLGRLYEGDGFTYVLQVGECDKPKSKVKVKKWVGISDSEENNAFILRWHGILKMVRSAAYGDEQSHRVMVMKLLETFYQNSFSGEVNFYSEFNERADIFEKQFT